MLPLVKFYPDHSQNPLQTFWSTEMVRRFGLVNPGNPSKVPPTCLVFGDNHKYFISKKKIYPLFVRSVTRGGLMWYPYRKLVGVIILFDVWKIPYLSHSCLRWI